MLFPLSARKGEADSTSTIICTMCMVVIYYNRQGTVDIKHYVCDFSGRTTCGAIAHITFDFFFINVHIFDILLLFRMIWTLSAVLDNCLKI